MNGEINIRIEASDYIGHSKSAQSVGKLNGSEVFIDETEGQIVICQYEQSIVIS